MLKRHLLPAEETLRGEADDQEKKRIVTKYSAKWSKYAAATDRSIAMLFQQSPVYQGREDLDAVRTDMHFCRFAYGFLPSEYCYFGLEGKSAAWRRDYISDLDRLCFKFSANDFAELLFSDKWRAYEFLKPYYRRDAVSVSQPEDFDAFRAFAEKHPVFVKKLVDGSFGKGVELIDSQNCGKTLRELFDWLLAQGKMILEERIRQSGRMAALNESSVNTVRLCTFYTRSGIATPFGFIRSGRAGAFVDNGGAGGIFAAVDTKTGVIIADGCDELGGSYAVHPDSGVRYVGFELPEWDKAVALASEMASLVPNNKYIGWDLAYTDKGWVVVEANTAAQFLLQGSLKRGVKPELEAVMRDMDLIV